MFQFISIEREIWTDLSLADPIFLFCIFFKHSGEFWHVAWNAFRSPSWSYPASTHWCRPAWTPGRRRTARTSTPDRPRPFPCQQTWKQFWGGSINAKKYNFLKNLFILAWADTRAWPWRRCWAPPGWSPLRSCPRPPGDGGSPRRCQERDRQSNPNIEITKKKLEKIFSMRIDSSR